MTQLRPVRSRLVPAGGPARAGFTMLELLIVIAIIGILTAAGYIIARDIVPQYRTRKAAMEFANAVEQCRSLAIHSGRRCRILMLEGAIASELSDLSSNAGSYEVDLEIPETGDWDTLPIDTYTDTTDDNASTGIVDLSADSPNGMRHVSILDWGTISGPGVGNDSAIVFDTRGFVENPASDFTNGVITITFVNEVAEKRGTPDRWNVQITRAGVAHLDSSRSTSDDNLTLGGTATNTTYDSSGSFRAP